MRANTSTISVRNPATGAQVGTVPDLGADEVRAAVDGLTQAQPAWEQLGVDGRAKWLRALRDWILDHEEEIADAIQAESGRPRAEAVLEPQFVADLINYWASHAKRFIAEEQVRPFGPFQVVKKLKQVYRPHPVAGIITPWNFPFLMPAFDAIPALMAGCAVVVKPSEVTPLSAVLLGRAWEEIGAPPVLQVLTGGGETGAAVVGLADFVQFTGSTATGRKIGQAAAARLVPFSLELGGKDPAIVLADADIDRAVATITWGGIMNAGQACVSVERVYVEAPVYDEFVDKLVTKVNSLRQGVDEPAFNQDVGPMATEAQAQIVRRHVDAAIADGAKALTGGTRTGIGTFFEPTVLVDVDHSMACMTDETFGPTIPVMKVADVDEAVKLANDSPYGLSASVWTRDLKRGEEVARRLEVGAVNINDALANIFTYPLAHSGWKQSGLGSRNGGAHGIRKYCRTQSLTSPRFPAPPPPIMYPYSAFWSQILRRLNRAVVAGDPLRKLGLKRNSATCSHRTFNRLDGTDLVGLILWG